MPEMAGKMSVQAKIAELESRIAKLEERYPGQSYFHATNTNIRTAEKRFEKAFGEHWDKMWEEFNLMMKEVFKH